MAASSPVATGAEPLSVIEPGRSSSAFPVAELWSYRELLALFVSRDVKVRYKQTLLGVAWVVLQPLLTTLILVFFFGRLAKTAPDGSAPLVFFLSAMIPWIFFAQAVTQTSGSLLGSASLLTKVYFPRILLPAAAALASLADALVASALLIPVALAFGGRPGWWCLVGIPLALVLTMVSALAFGIPMSALTVRYRDVRHVVPFVVQLGLFVTPILYPASAVADLLARNHLPPWLAGLNPMAGAVEVFRWSLAGSTEFPTALVLVGSSVSLLAIAMGYAYFRRAEPGFADVV